MPSPTARRKTVPQPPTAVDIANSNRTMDTLLGRPRHSWMTTSTVPTSLNAAPRPRPDRRMTDQSKPSQRSTDCTTRPNQANRTQSQDGAKQTLPVSGSEKTNGLATLPSPQSTVQTPATLIASTDSHTFTASNTPRQATASASHQGEPVSRTPPSVTEADQTQGTVSTSTGNATTASASATAPLPTLSSTATAATPIQTLVQDADSNSVAPEGTALVSRAESGNDSAANGASAPATTIRPSNKRPAETQDGNDAVQGQGPAKRMRANHIIEQSEVTLNQTERMVQACGGKAQLNRIEGDRFEMVKEALTAENKDLFILLLLQTYSQWSLSHSSDVYDYLDLPQDVVVLSFETLGKVLGPHTNMRQTLQEFFANLLGDLRILDGHQWVHAHDQLRHFLHRFGKVWASELQNAVDRGRPFMVSELRDDLLCPSERLQRNLFAHSGRTLQARSRQQPGEASYSSTQTLWDRDLERRLEALLKENQAVERRWNGTNTSMRDREAGRAEIENRLRSLFSARLVAAPPSLTPIATEHQRGTQSSAALLPIGSGIQSPANTASPVPGPPSQQAATVATNNVYQGLPTQLQPIQVQHHSAFIPQTTIQEQRSQQQQNLHDQPFASQQQNVHDQQFALQQQHARRTGQLYPQQQSLISQDPQSANQQSYRLQQPYQAPNSAQFQRNMIRAQHSQLAQTQSLPNQANVTTNDTFADAWLNGGYGAPHSGDQGRLRAQASLARVQTPQNPIPNFNYTLPANTTNSTAMQHSVRMPATAYDPRQAQTGQAGQVNQDMRFNNPSTPPLNNESLLPAPRRNVRVIHPTDYPHDSEDWTSLRAGLHLVDVRSPPRDTAEPIRFHQYIESYLAPPRVVRPHYGLVDIQFDVTQEQMLRRPTVAVKNNRLTCVHGNNTRRVRFRLCKVPNPADQEFAESVAVVSPTVWPKTVFFTINGNTVSLKRKQHFRWDLPAEITGGLSLGENHLQMSFPEYQTEAVPYWLTIECITTASESVLRQTIDERGHFLADETRDKIRQRLKASDDDDLVVTDNTLTISIADPFSSTMCKVPVRSVHCQHLQCFDLNNWLSSRPTKFPHAEGEPTKIDEWKCPICATDARPSQLRVDDYFREIITQLQAEGKVRTRQVVVDERADWKAVEEPDDSEDDDEGGPGEQKRRVGSRSSSRPASRTPAAPAVIVLDDSD